MLLPAPTLSRGEAARQARALLQVHRTVAPVHFTPLRTLPRLPRGRGGRLVFVCCPWEPDWVQPLCVLCRRRRRGAPRRARQPFWPTRPTRRGRRRGWGMDEARRCAADPTPPRKALAGTPLIVPVRPGQRSGPQGEAGHGLEATLLEGFADEGARPARRAGRPRGPATRRAKQSSAF